MVEELKNAFSRHPPLVYASGHDHSLQILDGNPFAGLLLVSGGGSSHKLTPVGSGTDTIFADSQPGFMALEFLDNGEVDVHVIEAGSTRPRFSKHLNRTISLQDRASSAIRLQTFYPITLESGGSIGCICLWKPTTTNTENSKKMSLLVFSAS